MRFLLDQSTDARLVALLRQDGHDTVRVGSEHPGGISDEAVLSLARDERRILITDDRDFGELIFRERRPHMGVIYLRLGQYAELADKIARLQYVLAHYSDRLDEFLVVTPQKVRVR